MWIGLYNNPCYRQVVQIDLFLLNSTTSIFALRPPLGDSLNFREWSMISLSAKRLLQRPQAGCLGDTPL